MFENLPFFPEAASTQAGQVDALYFFLVAVSAFFAGLIAILVTVFAVRFRRRRQDEVGAAIHGSIALELLWTIIPLGIAMVMFVWGAKVFFHLTRPPKGAMEVYVVGKQWMWKLQHMDGAREINELHVPIGQPVKLIMGSEDVIHSFFLPAFRVKADVIPGRYNTLWFTATKPGRYHIFCTQYCGTKHSNMIGWVTAMEPADYQAWLSSSASGLTMADNGAKLFQDLACSSCHAEGPAGQRGPSLRGAYGKPVQLASGQTTVMDDAYVRESIVNPQAKVVAGFQPIMPTYQGLVDEDQLLQLIAYVKSLGGPAPGGPSIVPPSERPQPPTTGGEATGAGEHPAAPGGAAAKPGSGN
jgi:cytochrome c oxidase subunit 2